MQADPPCFLLDGTETSVGAFDGATDLRYHPQGRIRGCNGPPRGAECEAVALEVSQRGYVMESGLITLSDKASALLANPQVRQAYLGE